MRVDKNWREGRFGTRTAKDASSTRCYCMLFDEEQDILLSGNTSGEVQVRRLGTSEMLNSWVAHKRASPLCSLVSFSSVLAC